MLIYLASPYTHADPEVMEHRWHAVCEYGARMMRAGWHIFSPIAHGHALAQYDLLKDYDYWREYDRKMIAKCNAFFVLQLDGYMESKGVQDELKFAYLIGLPITMVHPDLDPPMRTDR